MFSLRVKRPWYLFIRNGILLCSLFIASFVQAQQKNITIEFKNELLAEALKKLEKLSSYKILFTYEEVQDYKVTASLKNATILEALGKVLEGKPFIHSDITDGKYISVKYQQSPKVPAGPARTVKGAVLAFPCLLLVVVYLAELVGVQTQFTDRKSTRLNSSH